MIGVIEDIRITDGTPADAAQLGDYLETIYVRESYLITRDDEFVKNIWRQRRWLKEKATNPYVKCMFVKADSDDGERIVAMLDSWTDTRARVRHVTTFAMTVAPDFRRQGLGKRLLEEFCRWVAEHPTLEKIELHVHHDNAPALALYDKLGFEQEGIRRRAVRYEDGREVDDIIMGFWP